jgi:primosomal protein N' (replication factor Y) (superfamily II helicase)
MSSPPVAVVFPQSYPGPLDYAIPEGWQLAPGDFVEAPLGKGLLVGVVWERAALGAEMPSPVPQEKLRLLAHKLDIPPLPEGLRALINWVSHYYLVRLGSALRLSLANPGLFTPAPVQIRYHSVPDFTPAEPLSLKQEQLVARLVGLHGSLSTLARQAKTSPAMLKKLVEIGALHGVAQPKPTQSLALLDPDFCQTTLNAEQQAGAQALIAAVQARQAHTLLLEGVTGSGKTEVYFEALAQALRQGSQALVLLPEIAMTRQWFSRFQARFGAPPLEWHSSLTPAKRRDVWQAVGSGQAQVVVGTRSALFLPFARLGVLVVDEEHETSFKQEEGVAYHARDGAVVRAHKEGCPVVLASATPSLETLFNVRAGRYQHVSLSSRYGAAALAPIQLVDMRAEQLAPQSWLSARLRTALHDTLERGEQALLFLNRRGYAPLTLCRACGTRLSCPNCTAWLVEHKHTNRLQCHHCGYASPMPTHCQTCGAQDSFVAIGPGVERIAEEVQRCLPQARPALVTSDTLTTPAKAQQVLEALAHKRINLLIGTQMLAKGYHFPELTLVGVVDADLGLSGGDLRAAERTYQQITQVAGRAGRAEKPGRVLLQTYQPDAPLLQALCQGQGQGQSQSQSQGQGQGQAFYAQELEARAQAGMPPFSRLAALIVSGLVLDEVRAAARQLAQNAPQSEGVRVLGPAPAPLALLRGRHRMRLLLIAPRTTRIQPLLRAWLSGAHAYKNVHVALDVDPYSFM